MLPHSEAESTVSEHVKLGWSTDRAVTTDRGQVGQTLNRKGIDVLALLAASALEEMLNC